MPGTPRGAGASAGRGVVVAVFCTRWGGLRTLPVGSLPAQDVPGIGGTPQPLTVQCSAPHSSEPHCGHLSAAWPQSAGDCPGQGPGKDIAEGARSGRAVTSGGPGCSPLLPCRAPSSWHRLGEPWGHAAWAQPWQLCCVWEPPTAVLPEGGWIQLLPASRTHPVQCWPAWEGAVVWAAASTPWLSVLQLTGVDVAPPHAPMTAGHGRGGSSRCGTC